MYVPIITHDFKPCPSVFSQADAGSNGVHPGGGGGAGAGGDHSRFRQHREALSSMVDQLTLDQQAAAAAAAAAAQSAYINDTAHAEENWQQWRRQQQQGGRGRRYQSRF